MGDNMEDLTKIARLLGEDNEKKLKDGIVEMLLKQAQYDLESKYEYDYSINFDDIYDEVKKEVREEVKEKLKRRYMEFIEQKMMECMSL
jgi:hypothetical protein